jgi:hypothetical protein
VNYPPIGSTIELLEMPNDPDPIPVGTRGIVVEIRDGCPGFEQIEVKWENGRTLFLLPGADRWRIVSE